MTYDRRLIYDLKARAGLVLRLVFLCVVFSVAVVGQEPPKAVLLDEFGNYPCDGFRGRIDNLLAELRDNPDWDALVVNSGSGDGEISAILREQMIRNHVMFRGFDRSRIRYNRSTGDTFHTQFFRVARERDSQLKMNYALSSLTHAVVFVDYESDDLCPAIDLKDAFASILEQNPGIRSTVLIRDETIRKADKREAALSKYLFRKRGIDPKRIQFFRLVKPDFDYGNDPYFEFRLIP